MPRMTQDEYNAFLAKANGGTGIPLKDVLTAGAVVVNDEPIASGRELELHNQIIRECRRRGWVYVHSNPTKKATNQPGTPDFIIYGPAGYVLSVECKTATGRLSKEQTNFKREVEALGHVYHIVRSLDHFNQIAHQVTVLAALKPR